MLMRMINHLMSDRELAEYSAFLMIVNAAARLLLHAAKVVKVCTLN